MKDLARSDIDLLALSANFRPISSRLLVSGSLKGLDDSKGSSFPSDPLGVDSKVPHVRREGKSSGEGDGSLGSKG